MEGGAQHIDQQDLVFQVGSDKPEEVSRELILDVLSLLPEVELQQLLLNNIYVLWSFVSAENYTEESRNGF